MNEYCKHKHTKAEVNVIHLEDEIISVAEIKIICEDCNNPFEFIGFPKGLSFSQPMVSPDKQEARLPMILTKNPIGIT